MKKLNLREIEVQILKVFRLNSPTLVSVPYFYPFFEAPTTPSVGHLSALCTAGGKTGILEGRPQKATRRHGSAFAGQQEITKNGCLFSKPLSRVLPTVVVRWNSGGWVKVVVQCQ